MRRKRYNFDEYPFWEKGDKPQKDANGHSVKAFSQLNADEQIDPVHTTNWAGYADPTHPSIIEEMQRDKAEWIDHLLSNLNDNRKY